MVRHPDPKLIPIRDRVMKIIVCDKSTRRLSPSVRRRFVQNAQQQLPQRVRRFPISSNNRNEIFSFSV